MKIAIVLGTRPEIIKLSSIIRYCRSKRYSYFIIHSNQHYSNELDSIFFKELELPTPKYNLKVGSGDPGEQTAKMIIKTEKIILKEKPDVVIVQGDTNTVLAGAIAASKQNIPVAHVEAGLRSYDWRMPEEKNRIMTDHISEYLFSPTKLQEKILLKEGIDKKKIFVVGNTAVDAVKQNSEISLKKDRLVQFGLEPRKYFLITIHRAENTDDKKILSDILDTFGQLYEKYQMPMLYPMHPRTQKMIKEYKIKLPQGLTVIDPVGYLDFIQLMRQAQIILTDSGGIQEEACVIKTPCVTIRDNTERPETVQVGANVIAGTKPATIKQAVKKMLNKNRVWQNPLGDGRTGEKIIEKIRQNEKN